ncbi:hypothetical protein [Rhizobium paknamense]|uniref:Flagellar biosynthetic protein FliP n=1 Tax=Rhizobium paknamense TaxID=1206817 RepID=A0ABU0I8H0_9HYPH|nr:hypothetical protein [Rhizobium paknamense]MDQ0454531.1 hypothetical protein [Rhizobium paknamense]
MSELSPAQEDESVEVSLKPVMILVFSLKIAVTALLLGNLALPSLLMSEPELAVAATTAP